MIRSRSFFKLVIFFLLTSLRYILTLFQKMRFCFFLSSIFFRLSLYLPWLIYSCFVVAFVLYCLIVFFVFFIKICHILTFLLFFKNLGCARIRILRPMWFHVCTSAFYFVEYSEKQFFWFFLCLKFWNAWKSKIWSLIPESVLFFFVKKANSDKN